MWFPVSAVAALCVILDLTDSSPARESSLEDIFRQRSRSDWENAWHHEKYSRCRETLVSHLYWACEKDIYRLTRRSEPPSYERIEENEDNTVYEYPLMSPKLARQIVRMRRGGSSITSECCSSTGCTWEEYAEYCPTNKRHTVFVN